MITKEFYGSLNGREVSLYTLDNGYGVVAKITDFGGIITSLYVNGTDVVLGYDTLDEYVPSDTYFGALIGRNSNRIQNAEFELNGKKYTLAANNGKNNLHGGNVGFDKKVWDAEMVDEEEPSLILTLSSPDGEEGFPGNANIKVTYTVTKENSIKIHYEGVCDADTVMNLTNHSYFNMNGHESGATDGHSLTVFSDFHTPGNDECMPTGEILASAGTVFDLNKPTKMADVFASDAEQIKMFGGFDHNFCLKGMGMRKVAVLTGDKSNITMETYTDLPGVQIYCGNNLDGTTIGKGGVAYAQHQGMCLETQVFPDGITKSHFPSPVLKKGDKYDTTTEYKFVF